jgi:hypothetical protein
VYPASATQAITAVDAIAPAVEELKGQGTQEAAPMATLNVLAKHAVKLLLPSEPV